MNYRFPLADRYFSPSSRVLLFSVRSTGEGVLGASRAGRFLVVSSVVFVVFSFLVDVLSDDFARKRVGARAFVGVSRERMRESERVGETRMEE